MRFYLINNITNLPDWSTTIKGFGWNFKFSGIFKEYNNENYLKALRFLRTNDNKETIVPVNRIADLCTDNFTVDGDVNISGLLTVFGGAYISGILDVKNEIRTPKLSVYEYTNLYGHTTIQNDLYILNGAYITSNVEISNGNLTMNNGTIEAEGINAGGNVNIAGSLDVAGETHLRDDLTVSGFTQLNGGCNISGDLVVHNSATFNITLTFPVVNNISITDIKNLPDSTAVNMQTVKKVIANFETIINDMQNDYNTKITNLRNDIFSPKVPNGIVYIDNRADTGGKQTITSTKEVPTPAL